MNQSQVVRNYSIAAKQQSLPVIEDHPLVLSQSEHQLLQSFMRLMTSTDEMGADSSENLRRFLEGLIQSETISNPLLNRLVFLQKNAQNIFLQYHQFIDDLTHKNFSRICLNVKTVELLNVGLSLDCQRTLSDTLQKTLYGLDEDDVCRYALLAFQRLLVAPQQPGPQYTFDKNLLNAFERLQETFPSIARELFCRLQEELHTDRGIKTELVLGRVAGSWHAGLLALLPENHLSVLRMALISRLQRLLEMPRNIIPHETLQLEWVHYQKLIHIVQSLPGESRDTFNNLLVRLGRKAFSTFEESVKTMHADLNFFLQHQKNTFRREYLWRCACFISLFGSFEKKERLNKLIEQIFNRVQKSLMGNEFSKTMAFMDWANPLVDLISDREVKAQTEHLKRVCSQVSHLSEKQKMVQIIAPCALVAYFDSIRKTIENGLQRYPVLNAENLFAIRESLSLHLQYYQLPYPIDLLMSSMREDKASAFSWLRRSVCEKQEPYLLYGLLMLAKVCHMRHQWQERLRTIDPLPIVRPEAVAQELGEFGLVLKQALQLGQGQLPRKIQEVINDIEGYF